ncbi:transcription factor-like 5 protein [Ictalurus furcatus]|uniref:transcription factor-like 5 protein n=1 Tax=Ictalurus furcatus TaxID=66913 RepID=UPI002350DB7A|nr:transcription factor-like 5 protein [Ictalurus furcatus]XP_053498743.1 transcription factor-like 5 protein [Ictalurus furcatus]
MTTSVSCKTSYVTPPSGQYVSEPVNVIISQKECDQGQVVNSEFNLMEMTEVEYTHLQHLIQSHMEAQDGPEELRVNPPSTTECGSENSCKACPFPYASPACPPDASSSSSFPTDVQFVSVPSNQGSEDSQEVKMLLYSDPSSISTLGGSTPTSNGEVPSSMLVKLRCVMDGARERNDNRRVLPLGSRPNPPARVCLEKRFNCDSCDLTKKQESQAAVLNTFLSMLHNSTDVPGIAMHSEPENWSKVERTAAVECGHPYTGNQRLCHFSQLLEGSKHPAKNPSVSKSADSVPKSPCIIYADVTTEEQVINMENEGVQKAVKRARTRGARTLQARDPNIMQGSGKWNPVCLIPGRKPDRRTRLPLEISQRKETHNLKERDRRRRIRLCCDELNMLVPFCNAETDKATTLQWTTAYLKYIREIYGDSLKQGFQNTFCGKTGVRIKPSCANDAAECENAASKE